MAGSELRRADGRRGGDELWEPQTGGSITRDTAGGWRLLLAAESNRWPRHDTPPSLARPSITGGEGEQETIILPRTLGSKNSTIQILYFFMNSFNMVS